MLFDKNLLDNNMRVEILNHTDDNYNMNAYNFNRFNLTKDSLKPVILDEGQHTVKIVIHKDIELGGNDSIDIMSPIYFHKPGVNNTSGSCRPIQAFSYLRDNQCNSVIAKIKGSIFSDTKPFTISLTNMSSVPTMITYGTTILVFCY
jgi:hypothetical protein